MMQAAPGIAPDVVQIEGLEEPLPASPPIEAGRGLLWLAPPPLRARPQQAVLWAMVIVFLLLFASRITRLNGLNLQKDEVWSVWITLGSLPQTLNWVGYDWPPGHFILLHLWRFLTGISPFAVRVSTILTLLICAALVFRIGRRLFDPRAGILAALAFGGFTYVIFLSTIVRGYFLNLTLWCVALLLAINYFARPSPRRGIILGVALAAMFYVHNTAVMGMAMIGLFTLITSRRPLFKFIPLWLPPGLIMALLCLPEALSKLDVLRIKRDIVDRFIPYVRPDTRLLNHYLDYVGGQPALWGALILIGVALVLDKWRFHRRTLALGAWVLAPVALMWVTWNIDAFQARHLAWVMVGFAMWIGAGLALLPRPAMIAVALVMGLSMFDRLPLDERYETVKRLPFVTLFEELKTHHRNGDALFLDLTCANCIPIDAEEWDYFTRAYFPNGGLTFVNLDQLDQRFERVWYVTFTGKGRDEYRARVSTGRAPGLTFGDEILTFQRYESPPDAVGVLFENGLRFHGAEILNDAGLPLVWREGDTVTLRLWWSVDQALEYDYSVGAYLWQDGVGVTAQVDAPPQVLQGPQETSKWTPGSLFVEERILTLPYPLTTGTYPIMLSVYQWWDGTRIIALGVTPDKLLPIGTVYVKSW
ncbi:MAG: glycosyltransferase family 39 protein [Anaerolinea sp.]|nr:glycosyltransferase family 39 protein [Anaerolinea sp.]